MAAGVAGGLSFRQRHPWVRFRAPWSYFPALWYLRASQGPRDCSQYGHYVFGGEQSDASCFVRHGGLRWWGSSPACGRVCSGRRCRPLGPLVCKAGQQRALSGCPVRAAKRAAHSSRPSWVGLPCCRSSKRDERLRDKAIYRASNISTKVTRYDAKISPRRVLAGVR